MIPEVPGEPHKNPRKTPLI